MNTDNDTERGHLALLRLFVQLQGLPLDMQQLAHALAGEPEPQSAAAVAGLLQAVGLTPDSRVGSWAQLGKAVLPVLARRRDGQWMLVGQVQGDKAVVQLAGQAQPVTLPRQEFEAAWSGVWIAAPRASTQGQAGGDAPRKFGMSWFWLSLGRYKVLLGEVLLASLFVQVFALVTPLIFQVVIDKVLTHRTLGTLDVMVVALLGVTVFEVVLAGMRQYLLSHTTHQVDAQLGGRLFSHLLRLPLAYFEARRTGETVARVQELENARNFMTGQALSSGLDLMFAVVFLAVMFSYSPTLTFMVLAALPVLFAASWITAPLLRKKLEDKFSLAAGNQAFLAETVGAMETLKSQAVEPQWQREWERRLGEHAHSAFHSGRVANASSQFVGLASKLLTVALLYFGARLVIDGQLSVGGLIAFNMLAGRVNAPILKLASLWQDYTQAKVSVRRLADIMDAPAEPPFRPGRSAMAQLQGSVAFEGVSFRYTPERSDVLDNLSFQVQAGEVIGIVGVSGAGKTSLMRLMQRLYVPQRGRILIDGVDLGLMDTAWLRRQIGVVGQDALLFNRTVRENIALGSPHMAMEQIVAAAQLAGAHDFILDLPDGYDTLIGERGGRLSGGQRARLAIARALATQPRLLLLDEATAQLDYESERAIHDRMAQICAGRTVFIVAHRLPTLRLASRILVLDHGRVVETGTHTQLMAGQGRYASLYKAHQVMDSPVAPLRPVTELAEVAHA